MVSGRKNPEDELIEYNTKHTPKKSYQEEFTICFPLIILFNL